MTAVRFNRRGDITAVTFAYDPIIVGTIKLVVPSFLRRWNPVRREWLILEPVYGAELARVLRGAGTPSSDWTTHQIVNMLTIRPPGRGQSSSASDPPGHHWPTGCCPGSATPITVGITNSSSN
jgi:hypothetical protein